MHAMVNGRHCNVTVTGKVQGIGFRKFIESTANSHHVRGYVFNDPNGSVKMLCGGSVESLDKFFHAVQTRTPSGVSIERFIQNEIVTDTDLNLPPEFLKLGTDEISDIGRKLDTGVKLLGALPDIKESVSILPDIRESVSILPDINTGIDAMNLKFDAFMDEQKTHNKRMRQILQKLAEK